MEKLKLAIVGASGLVGQTVLKVLKEKDILDKFDLFLIVSDKTAGKMLMFNSSQYRLLSLNEKVVEIKFDYVIMSAGDDVSLGWAPKFANAGSVVIDNSNAFRRNNEIPLIVPEINIRLLRKNDKIISNPNCSTIQLVLVLDKLLKIAEIEQVVVSSYQSVSGAGKMALNDLLFDDKIFFQKGIRNNIIPFIGGFNDNGVCSEEDKIMFETNKILKTNIKVCATTVRVPISNCHGESVYVRFKQKVDIDDIKKKLECNYIVVGEVFYPTDCANTNLTYVCRFRKVSENEIMFFVIADNLRRGAAYNAVLILENILNKKI